MTLKKYEKIAMELTGKILKGEIPVGGKLPSVARICKEYGVSSITAHHSIRELEKRGLVKCYSGAKGTLVISGSPQEKEDVGPIACLLRNFMVNYVDEHYIGPGMVIQSIQTTIAKYKSRMIYHSLQEEDYAKKMLELTHKSWIAGMVLDQNTPPELVKKIAASTVPAVLFGRMQLENNLNVVIPDFDAMYRKIAAAFSDRGYKRFIFYPDPERSTFKNEGIQFIKKHESYFINALLDAGFTAADINKIPEVYPKCPENNIPENFGLPRKKSDDWQPVAIYSISYTMIKQVLEAVALTDLIPGKDIGMVCSFPAYAVSNISYWTYDSQEFGAETVHSLMRKIKDPGTPSTITRIPVMFVDNGTL